jgi:hypothetical protein
VKSQQNALSQLLFGAGDDSAADGNAEQMVKTNQSSILVGPTSAEIS